MSTLPPSPTPATASPSRREVLTIAAVTVSLPMVQSMLGTMRQASAAASAAPATAPALGWFDTKLKAKDLKDEEFIAVDGHAISEGGKTYAVLLSRSGNTINAMENKCSHKQCAIKPTAGAKILTCSCHRAQYNLDGSVAKAPATKDLNRYAMRLTAAGTVEVDTSNIVAKDAKEAVVTLS